MNCTVLFIASTLVCAMPLQTETELLRRSHDTFDVIVTRTTTTVPRWLNDWQMHVTDIVDTVQVTRAGSSEEPVLLWRADHVSPGRGLDVHGLISEQASMRLVFYDALLHDHEAWILYASQMHLYMDHVIRGEDGAYVRKATTMVTSLLNSGYQPYLIDSGAVFQHDDAVHVALRLLGGATHRDADGPDEIWRIENDASTRVHDVEAYLQQCSDRVTIPEHAPRLREQIKMPAGSRLHGPNE